MSEPLIRAGAITDPALADARIEASPPAIRALFREYDPYQVLGALTAAGINDDPAVFTDEEIAFGVEIAEGLLKAEQRRRQNDRFQG